MMLPIFQRFRHHQNYFYGFAFSRNVRIVVWSPYFCQTGSFAEPGYFTTAKTAAALLQGPVSFNKWLISAATASAAAALTQNLAATNAPSFSAAVGIPVLSLVHHLAPFYAELFSFAAFIGAFVKFLHPFFLLDLS